MTVKKIKIAIISDLHCHPSTLSSPHSSYLLTDKLRSPSSDHPVESLLHLIENEGLTVDITLCPGDFTDKSNTQGFISGWDFSIEISQKLKAKEIIATVGNHDVDVYQTISNYSLKNAKGIKKGFPIADEATRDTFWSKGCAFIENELSRVLVINSSHFHYNKESSHNGEISSDAMEYIDSYLKIHNDDKIKIAMSHHPPIAHPRKNLGEDDKIVNGEDLLDLLGKNNFDLFIYGHKHDPSIKYHGNYKLALFSSGSFSAFTNLSFTGYRNAFHIVELSKDKQKCKGEISTWTYLPNEGWKMNFDESAFAPISGFGNERTVEQIFADIEIALKDKIKLTWNEVSEKIPDLNNLIPDDSKRLLDLLESNTYKTDVHLWKGPKVIYNLKGLE